MPDDNHVIAKRGSWQATPQLRFVDRPVQLGEFYDPSGITVRVLQQIWANEYGDQEWHDVPIEDETE